MLSEVALWLAFCAIAFSGKHQNPLVFEKNGGPGNSEKPQEPSCKSTRDVVSVVASESCDLFSSSCFPM